MADIQLQAEKREKLGGSTASQLRRQGRVPGIVYGHGEDTVAFHVKELDLRSLIYTHETHTISLSLGGKSTRCVLREVQFDPVTDRVTHIDLVALHAGEKIRLEIPVNLVGTAPGTKDGGILDFVLHKLMIDVLPDAIPEHIDVNVSDLRINHAIHIKDLPAHPSYTVIADENAVIISCAPPKTGDTEAAAAVTEPEQIQAKGKKEEA